MNGRCDGWCLSKSIFWFFYTATFIFVVGGFIFWLIFSPSEVKFHVTEASLTQFNYTAAAANNTLNYKLALNITLRNSNKRVGIYYDRIEAIAYYGKNWLSTASLTPFYQGHKNTSVLRPVFEGQQVLSLGTRDLSKFDSEKSAGVYNIDINLSVKIRIKYGKIKTLRFKPQNIDCPLKVPLSSNGTVAEGFQATKCDNVYFFSDPNAMD
jgi:hypothetical protein